MTGIAVRPLSDDLPFGARIRGVTLANAADADVRAEVNRVFEERGMIVFEEMEPTNEMQMALSGIFGEPQVYALTDVMEASDRVDTGVVEFEYGETASSFTTTSIPRCATGSRTSASSTTPT